MIKFLRTIIFVFAFLTVLHCSWLYDKHEEP